MSASTEPDAPGAILLVDDDAFNREGQRLYLERHGYRILEAGDEQSAWQLVVAERPTAAVVDISIPPDPSVPPRVEFSFGLLLARHIKEAFPAMGVVLFSAYEDRGSELLEMVRGGLRGLAYKLKGCPPAELLRAIQDVQLGRVVIDAEVTNTRSLVEDLLDRLTTDERPWVADVLDRFEQLSPREQEVVFSLAASHSIDGIARRLRTTPRTVEHHIGNAYEKLGLRDLPPHLHRTVLLAKACMIFDLSSRK